MTRNVLFLSTCSSQNSNVKLDNLLDVANSSSGKSLIALASNNGPKAAANAITAWQDDCGER